MNKQSRAIAAINLKTIKAAYLTAVMLLIASAISNVINFIIMSDQAGTGSDVSPLNALWFLPLMAAITIPASNFRKLINLGGKRNAFLWGSLLTYVVLAACTSLFVSLSHFTIEPILERHEYFD